MGPLAFLLLCTGVLAAAGEAPSAGRRGGAPGSSRAGPLAQDSALLATKVTVRAAHDFAPPGDGAGDSRLQSAERGRNLVQELVARRGTEDGTSVPALLEELARVRVTPQVQVFAKQVLDDLAGTFERIEEAGHNDTVLRDKIYSGFAADATRLNASVADLASRRGDADAARKLHADCRDEESSLFAAKTTSEGRLNASEAVRDDKLALAEQQHRDMTSRFQDVAERGLGDLSHPSLAELANQVKEYHDVLSAYEEALQTYHDRLQESVDATKNHTEKVAACSKRQAAFEDSVCKLGEASETACSEYTIAYESRFQDYEAVADNVAARVADRKAEWLHLKRVACVLGRLAGLEADGDLAANSSASQDLEQCYATDFANANLTLPDQPAPARESCPPVPTWPCTDAFRLEEYADLPAGAAASACESTCSATPTSPPSPPPATAPPATPPPEVVYAALPSGASPSGGGGSAGQKSYTTPSGWTVSSDQATYNNGNLYWLSNAIDGSEACKPETASTRDMRYGQVINHYWLAAGRCQGDSWLQVQMDESRYVDHVELEPAYRSDGSLTHLRILADGKDVTPADFDSTLAAYNAGTGWDGVQATGAACAGMLRVDVKAVVQTVRLSELTNSGYCGFGEIRFVGKP